MYGLVQAGIIEHEALKEKLKPYRYAPAIITQGLWTNQYRDINFTLVVDDLGIKYRNKKNVNHLVSAPQTKYEVTKYFKRGIDCGITLKCNYTVIKMAISMSGYVKDTILKFQHTAPTRPQHSPHQCK